MGADKGVYHGEGRRAADRAEPDELVDETPECRVRGRHPIGICLDGPGRVWVSTAGGRVQRFTTEGRFLRAAGRGRGHEPGQFVAPHGLATDGRGNLFVVDSYNHRVQKLAVGR